MLLIEKLNEDMKIAMKAQDKETLNPHFVLPNYLKLPQVLEERHD